MSEDKKVKEGQQAFSLFGSDADWFPVSVDCGVSKKVVLKVVSYR